MQAHKAALKRAAFYSSTEELGLDNTANPVRLGLALFCVYLDLIVESKPHR
jgi:hypothetical protein